MDLGLRGRTAVVGGASRGLGRAVAAELAAEGCRLLLWSRGGPALEATAEALRAEHGAEAHTVGADAADPSAAAVVSAAAREALGRIDILVTNAGGPPSTDPALTDPDGWRSAFQLLAITPIELATALLPDMRAAGWGRIVAILSWGVRQPIPNLVYSNGGRSALAAWLKTTSAAVAPDGVTMNGVMPGRFDTDRVAELDLARAEREGRSQAEVRSVSESSIPLRRYGRPEELGALVAYLCSERASYQTGSIVGVDGGLIVGY